MNRYYQNHGTRELKGVPGGKVAFHGQRPNSGQVSDRRQPLRHALRYPTRRVSLRGERPLCYIEWIIERYQVKVDKDSKIVNDPNTWSDEPRYIVDLLARIVRVSIESVEIVDSLPALGL